jgi:hypothetical protein
MITASQRESIVNVLAKMLQAIDAYRDQIEIDISDPGIIVDFDSGYQPDLDALLKSWRVDPVGQGLRQGIWKIGWLVSPHITMQELQDIADDASQRSQNATWSAAIFDHMWDGLKTSDGETWCA